MRDQSVLVTGGTGSFGHAFVPFALAQGVRRLVIYSRDELKQSEMRERFPDRRLRFFIGDVRDRNRLALACHGIDAIIHAAAMKQVPACEYNPGEAVATNIGGAENVIAAALANNVPRTVALSSDKACNPVNLYGATKLCAEKLFLAGNAYAGSRNVRFSVVRYGNVAGSRGSVIPRWKDLAAQGVPLPITDTRMTRFWMTLDEAVRFVAQALDTMQGGELFVPELPSFRVTDLAQAMAPNLPTHTVGIRQGEKLHESLVGPDEHHVTGPAGPYTSDANTQWLGPDDLKQRLEGL